ncbi:unnamed protein product [Parajaminaea phylloscopi]
MGLFTRSVPSEGSESSGQQQQLPTRSARKACWDHRDAYFACLSKHDVVIPPGTDATSAPGDRTSPLSAANVAKRDEQRRSDPCKQEREGYERDCAKSWVDYFNKRRILEERQKRMLAASGPGSPVK